MCLKGLCGNTLGKRVYEASACFRCMGVFICSFGPDYFDTVYNRHTACQIKYKSLPGVENGIPE